jgi:hypothetical protein
VARKVKSSSLDVYKRSFEGALPAIWSKIPKEIINRGECEGWLKIKYACTDFLTGRTKAIKHKEQKATEVIPEICNTKHNNELNGNV